MSTTVGLGRYWSPVLIERREYGRPPVGVLIGFQGRAYRVISVDDIDPANWTEEENAYAARNTWLKPDRLPYRVRVLPVGDDREHGLRVSPWMSVTWHVLPEHYAVCAVCGDLAPCSGHSAEVTAARAVEKAEKDMAVLPGCCPACGEPITQRQATIDYPGPNLLNPLALPDVRFHTRQRCLSSAADYEEKWVAVDPVIRPRSLLTLRCSGSVIVHADGTGECHGAEDCPSIYARHRHYSACYVQTHGCGRECPREHHPGTRLAGRPRNLWAR